MRLHQVSLKPNTVKNTRYYLDASIIFAILVGIGWSENALSDIAGSGYQEPCLVGYKQINIFDSQQNTYIVDVRNEGDYDVIHIKNSLNIKQNEIKTKSFLKQKKVVIVGYGYDSKNLLNVCQKLRKTGFSSVRILDGGIVSWAQNKDGLQKLPGYFKSLYYLTPNQLLATDPNSYILIDGTKNGMKFLRNNFSNVVKIPIPKTLSVQSFIKHVSAINIENKPIILVGDNNYQYEVMHNSSNAGQTIFFLGGGSKELAMFEQKLIAILSKREFELQKTKGCGD